MRERWIAEKAGGHGHGMPASGKDFERAVFEFVRAVDPSAKILFDHRVPDRDSGAPRQVDVWIEATIGGHFPVTILVSCKDYKRKLDQGHIGTFVNEVRSTSASTGVLYSRSGFTAPAVKKASANGLACCRLYRGQPPDVPDALIFHSFACTPNFRLSLIRCTGIEDGDTWNDLFDYVLTMDEEKLTVLEALSRHYSESMQEALKDTWKKKGFPPDWAADCCFAPVGASEPDIIVRLAGGWRKYRARLEAQLLRGSYCLTNDSFAGKQIMPSIDMCGPTPGAGWEEISDPNFNLPEPCVVAVLFGGDFAGAVRSGIGTATISRPPSS
ncbi:MAG: restriction endonuclease [bacterium]|nr:restriction endonuclease [bacterium]